MKRLSLYMALSASLTASFAANAAECLDNDPSCAAPTAVDSGKPVPNAADTLGIPKDMFLQFANLLNKALAAQNIDLQKLDAERQEILGEPDHTVAVQKARLFHKKYRPYFENALIHLGVEGNAIQTALLDNPETSENINALTQIIPLIFTNCNNWLTQLICRNSPPVDGLPACEAHSRTASTSFRQDPILRLDGDGPDLSGNDNRVSLFMRNQEMLFLGGMYSAHFYPPWLNERVPQAVDYRHVTSVCTQSSGRILSLAATATAGIFGYSKASASLAMAAVHERSNGTADTCMDSEYFVRRTAGTANGLLPLPQYYGYADGLVPPDYRTGVNRNTELSRSIISSSIDLSNTPNSAFPIPVNNMCFLSIAYPLRRIPTSPAQYFSGVQVGYVTAMQQDYWNGTPTSMLSFQMDSAEIWVFRTPERVPE